MSATWKTARVFISSTFRDMHAERDHLVKVVFPNLRQWCEARRLHLVDIDLRWGVTEDEANNGKALEVCLAEIDGSRPFFVCLLGERYGWVPDALPPEELYRFRGLQAQTHLSITHLEILHATQQPFERLQPPPAGPPCPHAFFYFRRPDCIPAPESLTSLTGAQRAKHGETFFEPPPPPGQPDRRAMLNDLKAEIRKQFGPTRVTDYPGEWDSAAENPEDESLKGRLTKLDAFGERVETDLRAAIREQFAAHIAEALKPSASPEEQARLDERSFHDQFIENRTQVHVPRTEVEAKLDAYLASDDARSLVLSGPPGSGKSAILAHWLNGKFKALGPDGAQASPCLFTDRAGNLVIGRFIGASPSSTNLARLLGNVCEELRVRFNLTEEVEEEVETAPGQKEKRKRTQPMEVPADPGLVLPKWPKFLEAASAAFRSAAFQAAAGPPASETTGLSQTPASDKRAAGEDTRAPRILLVLDAINQLDSTTDPSRLFWIRQQLPPNVRFIVSVLDHGEASQPRSSRREEAQTSQSAIGNRQSEMAKPDFLATLRSAGFTVESGAEVPVPDLNDAERFKIIRDLPSVFCKRLDDVQIALLLANEATRNPLFLIVALEELRVFGSFANLKQRIADLPHLGRDALPRVLELRSSRREEAPSSPSPISDSPSPITIESALDALFGQVLDRLDRDTRRQSRALRALSPEQGLVRTLFRYLACAREGLAEAELRDLLARHLPALDDRERTGALQVVLRQVRTWLMHKGPLLDFYHRSFWKAVRAKYVPSDADHQATHAELAAYFRDQADPAKDRTWKGATMRPFAELPPHLLQARLRDALFDVLIDFGYLTVRVEGVNWREGGEVSRKECGDVYALLADFEPVLRDLDLFPLRSAEQEQLETLQRALDRSTHHLAKPDCQLVPVLHNSLKSKTDDASKLNARAMEAAQRVPRAWLQWLERPAEYHSALLRVIPQPGAVRAIAVVPPPTFEPPETIQVQACTTTEFEQWREEQLTQWRAADVTHRVMAVAVANMETEQFEIKLMDWTTGKALDHAPIRHEGNLLSSVALLEHRGQVVVASGSGRNVHLWDGRTGTQLLHTPMRHEWEEVTSVALLEHRGELVVASGSGRNVHLWDGRTGTQLLHSPLRHESSVRSVALLEHRGQLMVASSSGEDPHNGEVRLWDGRTGEHLLHTPMRHGSMVRSVALLEHRGQLVVASGSGHNVHLWDGRTGEHLLHTPMRHEWEEVTSVALLEHRGELVVASGSGRNVHLWDGRTGTQLLHAPMWHKETLGSFVLLEHLGQLVVASGSGKDPHNGEVRLWDGRSREPLTPAPMRHQSKVSRVALLEYQGELVVVSGSEDRTIHLWGAYSRKPLLHTPMRHEWEEVTSVALLEHRGELVVASGSVDYVKGQGEVRLWDGRTGKQLPHKSMRHQHGVTSVALLEHRGELVVASGSADNTVRLWDGRTGTQLRHSPLRHESFVWSVALLEHRGQLMVASGGGDYSELRCEVRLWDGRSGEPVPPAPMQLENWVMSVALLEHQSQLVVASGSKDRTARLWDGRSGEPLCAPLPHADTLNPLRCSPDGRVILTGYSLCALSWLFSCSPCGRWLLTSSGDCFLRLWSVPEGRLLAECPLETRPRAALFLKSGELAVAVDGHQPHSLSLLRFNLRNLPQ